MEGDAFRAREREWVQTWLTQLISNQICLTPSSSSQIWSWGYRGRRETGGADPYQVASGSRAALAFTGPTTRDFH